MPLVDTGLVVRYYFDEAASGSAPTEVVDASSNAYDLTTINYGSGNLAYNEVSGNRGLESTSTTGTQRAVRAMSSGDAEYTALNGGKTFTMEIVVRVDSWNASGSRVFGINATSGETGSLIWRYGTSGISVAFNNRVQGDFYNPASRSVVLADPSA